jgi:hypothetical protein
MPYLEYRTIDGIVEVIHETMPAKLSEGRAVVESDHFSPGQEIEYRIKVYQDAVKDGKATSFAAVRQGPPQQEIMWRIQQMERAQGIGQPGQKGISQRLDNLEQRLESLEG